MILGQDLDSSRLAWRAAQSTPAIQCNMFCEGHLQSLEHGNVRMHVVSIAMELPTKLAVMRDAVCKLALIGPHEIARWFCNWSGAVVRKYEVAPRIYTT